LKNAHCAKLLPHALRTPLEYNEFRKEFFARAPRAPPESIVVYKEICARAPRAPPEYIEFYKDFFARAARAPPQIIVVYTSFARARRARATPVAPGIPVSPDKTIVATTTHMFFCCFNQVL